MKKKFGEFFKFVKTVFGEFSDSGGMKFAASLAYYTVFALAPMLVLIISIFGRVFGREAVTEQLFDQINELVGDKAAIQIQDMIKNVRLSGDSIFAIVVSSALVIIAATSIFGDVQDSINKIWGLKAKPKKAWWKMILNRLLSFSMIISIGFIMVISLAMNAIVTAFSKYIENRIPGNTGLFIDVVNHLLAFIISTFIFALIFKVLPDAKIKWKDVIRGALLTSVLFTLGKLGIGYYIASTDLSVYGAAAAIIIVMLWVYYSAIIIYLGAAFTKVYVSKDGSTRIQPNQYAVWVNTQEVETHAMTLQQETPDTVKAPTKQP
jgi:membrane protein